MATIGLDASYSLDRQPSGMAVYSRRLIESLATLNSSHRFFVCYRLSRIRQRRELLRPGNLSGSLGGAFSVRLFQEPLTFWLAWQVEVFHSLAQRPPAFHFKREIVTVLDIFPLTGRDYSTPDFQRKFSRLLLEAVERAALVITPSQYTADQLTRHTSVRSGKIRVVPLGVDSPSIPLTSEERLFERQCLVGKGNEMILSVGVIQNRKNTLNALRALQRLPACYRLVLAGGNGYGSETIHEFIRKERLESRVAVLGYVSANRLSALYQAASLFLFPSWEEGFGLPVLEAMIHGLPVVASGTSSLPEVSGEAALYIDPHDPSDIAEKILRAVEDQDLRKKMIAQGLARVCDFTWRRTAEATLCVYDEVLAM